MEIHKKLLASISPELDKHVNNGMREGIEGIICLPDEGEEVLSLFTQWAYTSDGHDQIMIEFCSTMICSISLNHRVPRSRS